jgi:hypothetical protein
MPGGTGDGVDSHTSGSGGGLGLVDHLDLARLSVGGRWAARLVLSGRRPGVWALRAMGAVVLVELVVFVLPGHVTPTAAGVYLAAAAGCAAWYAACVRPQPTPLPSGGETVERVVLLVVLVGTAVDVAAWALGAASGRAWPLVAANATQAALWAWASSVAFACHAAVAGATEAV